MPERRKKENSLGQLETKDQINHNQVGKGQEEFKHQTEVSLIITNSTHLSPNTTATATNQFALEKNDWAINVNSLLKGPNHCLSFDPFLIKSGFLNKALHNQHLLWCGAEPFWNPKSLLMTLISRILEVVGLKSMCRFTLRWSKHDVNTDTRS